MSVEHFADGRLALFLVIEEHEVLSFLLIGATCHIDGLHGVGVDAGVVHLGAKGHGCGSKVLYLFETVAEAFHLDCEVGHVLELAAGMGADEVRYQLVAKPCLSTDGVELRLGLQEKAERRFPHEAQHLVAGVFGGHLEPSADMV